MQLPPIFTLSPTLLQLLADAEALQAGFTLLQISPEHIQISRERSLLKSSLFSARIEGNPLTLDTITQSSSQHIHKKEIQNLVSCYQCIEKERYKKIDASFIKQLHQRALRDVGPEAGYFRTEESAIYNQAGVAVYLTPTPKNIGPYIQEWCTFVNTSNDHSFIVAALSHIWFEKIHPFLDGNGRVGRLLFFYILLNRGFDIVRLIPFEEYLDTHKDQYYHVLNQESQDVTSGIEFFLTAFITQARNSLSEIQSPIQTTLLLPPRRQELYTIIQEHTMVSFDFLHRRFLNIPTRTLHYDLAQLVKCGVIKKIGKTRGVFYTV